MYQFKKGYDAMFQTVTGIFSKIMHSDIMDFLPPFGQAILFACLILLAIGLLFFFGGLISGLIRVIAAMVRTRGMDSDKRREAILHAIGIVIIEDDMNSSGDRINM
jgi:hypothetical protein